MKEKEKLVRGDTGPAAGFLISDHGWGPQSLDSSGKAVAASIPLPAVRMTANIVSKLAKRQGACKSLLALPDKRGSLPRNPGYSRL